MLIVGCLIRTPIMTKPPLSSLLLLLLALLFYAISTLPLLTISTPTTVSISETGNRTIVCAINQQSFLTCTSFPRGIRIPGQSRNFTYGMTVAGDGFICATRWPSSSSSSSSSSSTSMMGCWRFAANTSSISDIPFKRIYRGPALDQLEAGNTHICGIASGAIGNDLRCWQWEDFEGNSSGRVQNNFSAIAVGDEFVCGLNASGNVHCLGNDASVIEGSLSGNYSVIAAGFDHACALSFSGSLDCWGQEEGVKPQGQFMDLALGKNRSCALRLDQTVVCWGSDDFSLPTSLQQTFFIAIVAKSRVFCGIVSSNYSLRCWGNEKLDGNPLVFENVMPGTCTDQCPCAPLPGSSSLCGPGQSVCQPCITQPSSSSSSPSSSSRGRGWSTKMVAFLVVGINGSIWLITAAAWFFLHRRGRGGSSRVHDSGRLEEEEDATPPDGPGAQPGRSPPALEKRLSHIVSMGNGGSNNLEEFPLEILLQVTDNFSQDHKIGRGSFGSVYRATLDDGREVAIKRAESSTLVLSNHPIGLTKRQEEKDTAFVAELDLLSRLNHKNLVRLLGFCEDGYEQVLVYEYMSNGTLHEHLHQLKSSSPLASWPRRIQVALDAARGIQYLHQFAIPPIIHRDIKSSNILLDENWTAKVSDFGLSLMGPNDDESHLSLRAAGTIGYMDPEYCRLHQLTTKSDVYSFGVVLLELLSGQKAIHLNEHGIPRNVVDLVVPYIVRDDIHRILDVSVPPPTPVEIEAVAYVGYLAADCVIPEGRDRPSMTEIVGCLERALTACLAPPMLHWSSATSSN